MTIAFFIRQRREDGAELEVPRGASVALDERREYVLRFPAPCEPDTRDAILKMGGEMLSSDTALLGFLNFIGEANVAGVRLQISSSKIGESGVSRLLQDVSELSSGLVFAHGSPTLLAATGSKQNLGPIPYHQLQFVRRAMVLEPPGRRLQDWLSIVERSAVRRIERERPLVPVDRIQRLDHRSTGSIFRHLERIVPVPANSPVAQNLLARALTFGSPPAAHFPKEVSSPRGKLSFDTPENRFIRHVVESCLALIYRFVDHPKLHQQLRVECRSMLAHLEEIAARPFIRESGRLTSNASPSQALVKADGYRELLRFWMDLQEHVSLPTNPEETDRMLEGRDLARLYEYWVFLKVLEAVVLVTGKTPDRPPSIIRDELGESLEVNVPADVHTAVSVRYNASFTRSLGTAYSTPLRPDVVLSVGGELFAFDAKYRLTTLPSDPKDSDEGWSTYKRADLYKMHTYRDAIHAMRAAFVVYPGDVFMFFDQTLGLIENPNLLGTPNGVGAVPLQPHSNTTIAILRSTIEKVLSPLASAPSVP